MDKIEELLTRGVDKIYPSKEELEKILRSGKKLRIYQGFDPTGPDLHIGHAVALRKLRKFQELGHHVIFLIGDFTARIGDPSGKSATRKILSADEIEKNAKKYKEQASKILEFAGKNPAEVKFNSEWLGKMSAIDFIKLARNVTYGQLKERDLFEKRIKGGEDVFVNELLYPIMQAYDSIAMNVDLELGGTDQTFNMLMGRKLMRNVLKKEKFVMTVPLLTDSEGNKIGKTEGNVIGISDPANEFYGKILALGDDSIVPCLTLLTDVPTGEIEAIKNKIEKGENPLPFKKKLAFELTKLFNSEQEAIKAQDIFEKTFQKKTEVPPGGEISISESSLPLLDLVFATKKVTSRSEAKRLITQKAVDIDGRTIDDPTREIEIPESGIVIKIGKIKFVRIKRK